MGSTQIRKVIVNPASSAALLLQGIRYTFHVAVVVVGPHDGDIIRHAQPGIIDIERFLVGHEDLRNLPGFPVLVFLQDLTLTGKDLFQCAGTVLRICTALHGLVVQAAHTHGIDVVILSRLADAVVQLFQDGGTVGLVIPLTVACLIPLRRSSIVKQQRFAMAGCNHDSPLVSHLLTFRMTVEGSRTGVHGRS